MIARWVLLSLVAAAGVSSGADAPPLILNEIAPAGAESGGWVELLNPNPRPVAVGGIALRFFGGGIVVLPGDAPDCPAGGRVVLELGQAGRASSLTGSTVTITPDSGYRPGADGDGCMLIINGEAVDAISWGEPMRMANLRLEIGPPLQPAPPGGLYARVPGTWPPEIPEWVGSRFWCALPAELATPGMPNPESTPHCRPPVYREEPQPETAAGISGFLRLEASMTMPGMPGGDFRVTETLSIEPGTAPDSGEYVHRLTWTIGGDPARVPVPGRGTISSTVSGAGEGRARITLEIAGDGRYRLVTDTEPRTGRYTITVSGPGVPSQTTTRPFHLGFADHHYGYVSPETPPAILQALRESGFPNVFEGTVTVLPDGTRIAQGEDTLTLPQALLGTLTGGTNRTWEVRIGPGE